MIYLSFWRIKCQPWVNLEPILDTPSHSILTTEDRRTIRKMAMLQCDDGQEMAAGRGKRSSGVGMIL